MDDELARPGGYQQPPAAQHAQRAWQQPQQAQRDDDAFGFAKLRAQVPPAGPVAAAAAAGAAVGASIDDATKQRVQEALRALKKDKKEKKGKRSRWVRRAVLRGAARSRAPPSSCCLPAVPSLLPC